MISDWCSSCLFRGEVILLKLFILCLDELVPHLRKVLFVLGFNLLDMLFKQVNGVLLFLKLNSKLELDCLKLIFRDVSKVLNQSVFITVLFDP